MRVPNPKGLFALVLTIALGGCELAVDFDRDKLADASEDGSGGNIMRDSGMENDSAMPMDMDANMSMDADTPTDAGGLPPTAVDDHYDLDLGWTLTISNALGVLTNDQNPAAGSLTAVLQDGPDTGDLMLRPGGGFTFESAPVDLGGAEMLDVSFTYVARNENGDSAPATVTITIRRNGVPSVPDVRLATPANTALNGPAGALLEGAVDPDGQTLTLHEKTGVPTSRGGTVDLFSDGSFHYVPKTGSQGLDAQMAPIYEFDDTFDFDAFDGDHTVTATATVHVGEDVVWYVDNTTTEGGDGSSEAPYDTLGEAISLAGEGHAIAVATGSGSYGVATLKKNQRLLGEGAPLNAMVDGNLRELRPAGTPPTLSSSNAIITLADGNVVAGLRLDGDALHGVLGDGVRDITLDAIDIRASVKTGIALSDVRGTVNASAIRAEGTLGAALAVSSSSADVTLSDFTVVDAYAGETTTTVGPAEPTKAAVELTDLSGVFSWEGGQVLYQSQSNLPGLLAVNVAQLDLSGDATTPLEFAGAGLTIQTGFPVASVRVEGGDRFSARYLAVHNQSPDISYNVNSVVGGLQLLGVRESISVRDSEFGQVAGRARVNGHGVDVRSAELGATGPLSVLVQDCRFAGDAARASALDTALAVAFDGNSDASVAVDMRGNELSQGKQLLAFRPQGDSGTTTPNTVALQQNTTVDATARAFNMTAENSGENTVAILDNTFSSSAASPGDTGIYMLARNSAGSQTALTVQGNNVQGFRNHGVLLESQPSGGSAAIVTDITGNEIHYGGSNLNTFDSPILLSARATGRLDATVVGNTLDVPAATYSVVLQTSNALCLDMRDNFDGQAGDLLPVFFDNVNYAGSYESAQADPSAFATLNDGATVNLPAMTSATCMVVP